MQSIMDKKATITLGYEATKCLGEECSTEFFVCGGVVVVSLCRMVSN